MTTSISAPDHLRLVSYLAPNWFWFYEAIGAFWQRSLSIPVTITSGQCDPLEDPLLLHDRLDVAFICGLPFARHNKVVPQQLQAIVAPVMQAPRYNNQPVYFSDVIVRADSHFKTFDQLIDATFCYNDSGSNSGYHLLRYWLMQGKFPQPFFNKVLQSGSHQTSIDWVADGKADCAAIDSIVLEQAVQEQPQLMNQLRVIESIGPSPVPPIVVAQRLGDFWIDRLQTTLLQPDTELQSQMQRANVQCFAVIQTAHYSGLAAMYEQAMQAGYEILGQNS